MLLSILVAHYKEPYETIRCLLTSIALQQGIDFADIQVIICNDGFDVLLDQDVLNQYPFSINYLIKPKSNISQVRQFCIDSAQGDYIMFCDPDDMFIDMLALRNLSEDILDGYPKILESNFVREFPLNFGENKYIDMPDYGGSYFHGKVFSKQFLIDKNIKMNPEFEILEDEYFVFLALHCTDNESDIKNIDNTFYLQKYNKDSVTQKDPNFDFYSYLRVNDVYEALIDQLIERGKPDYAQYFIINLTYDIYYTLNIPHWVDKKNKEYRDAVEARFSDFYFKYENLYFTADKIMVQNIRNGVRRSILANGLEQETVTFNDWMKHIKSIHQDLITD